MVCLFAVLSILNLFQSVHAALLSASSPCTSKNECESGECALSEPVAGAPKMCCKNDSTYSSVVKTFVCEDLDDGKPCLGWNGYCASGICGIDGLCTSEKLANESECGNDKQCDSGKCALSEPVSGAPKMCCKNDDTYSSVVKTFVCEDLDDGKPCLGWNGYCASGICGIDGLCTSEKLANESECGNDKQCDSGECALSEPVSGAPKMCCKNDDTYSSVVKTFVCEDLDDGKPCLGWNGYCASGICGIDGLCTSVKLANESECGNDKQCDSGECALSEPVSGAPKMCCKNDSKYDYSLKTDVCEDLPDGSQCSGDNDICESGICGMDGLCTSVKLANESECNNSVQCESGECALSEALIDAPQICCEIETSDDFKIGTSSYSSCGSLQSGKACAGNHALCQTGICGFDNLCVGNVNDTCDSDNQCASGKCTDGSCAPFSSVDDQNNFFNAMATCPLDEIMSTSSMNDTNKNIVLQVYDDYFKKSGSGFSDTGLTMVDESHTDTSATMNTIVGPELLTSIDGCDGGNAIVAQQQEGQVCFAYERVDDDGDGNKVSSCKNVCVDVGDEVVLETYDKSDTDIVGTIGFVNAFYFYLTQKCRIVVEYENDWEDLPPAESPSEDNEPGDSDPSNSLGDSTSDGNNTSSSSASTSVLSKFSKAVVFAGAVLLN